MSNALEQASLIMVPSGYEDGTLGSLKPTDGTGDFTFSRGSDISATRVNADGYIEKGYENLLLQSNQFDTSPWSLNTAGDTILTGGQSGYDGSNDAWELKNDGRAYFRQIVTYRNQVKTFSIYAKSGNQDSITIVIVKDGGDPSVNCDLGLGTITSSDNDNIDATITPVSGATGWYRISLTWLAAVGGSDQIRIYTGTTLGDTIYIQDAMLNQGLVAYPYRETTAAPVAGGILEDMPRLDYSNGSCPALLLEPQRTNLLPSSEYFGNNSGWTKGSGNEVILNNDAISPEGGQNATSLSWVNGNYFFDSITGDYTNKKIAFSFWAKGNSGETIVSRGNTPAISYQLKTHTFDGTWQRFEHIIDGGNGVHYFYVFDSRNGGTATSMKLYGAQLEQDATYPTSYIPTYGVSQTRLKDNCHLINGTSLPTAYPFTLFAEVDVVDIDSGSAISLLWSVVSNRYYAVEYYNNAWRLTARDGTSAVASSNIPVTLGTHKVLGVFTDTELNLYVNGQLVGSASNTQSLSTFANNLLIGQLRIVGDNGKRNIVNQALVFPTALSDDECIALTTIS